MRRLAGDHICSYGLSLLRHTTLHILFLVATLALAGCYAEESQATAPIAKTRVVTNVEEPCPPIRLSSPAPETDEIRLERWPSMGGAVWIGVTTNGGVHTLRAMRTTPPHTCAQQRLEIDHTRVLSAQEWQQLNHTIELANLEALKPESLEQQVARTDGTTWVVYARGGRFERGDLENEPFRWLCLMLLDFAGPEFGQPNKL